MKQIPGKQGEAVIRVVLEENEIHRLLDPILAEVNELRTRVAQLESDYLCQVQITAELETNFSRLLDDGR